MPRSVPGFGPARHCCLLMGLDPWLGSLGFCVSGAGGSGVYTSFLFPSYPNHIHGLSAVIQMDPLCPKYAVFCFPVSACLSCDLFSEENVFPLGDEPLHLSCYVYHSSDRAPTPPPGLSLPLPISTSQCSDPCGSPSRKIFQNPTVF